MTLAELKSALTGLSPPGGADEFPVAYAAFSGGQAPPFITLVCTDDADFIADDSNYLPIRNLDIELYTEDKDEAREAELESVLRGLGLVWSRAETYIPSEKMIQVTYSVQII